MPTISLTTFIDFVVTPVTSRITFVREAKKRYQRPYRPFIDFYGKLRNAIVEHHRTGGCLDGVLKGVTDKRKLSSYPVCVKGYRRWVARRQYEWVEPEGLVVWQHEDLEIRVNPELGLIIRDQEYRIKLYFKKNAVSKRKMDTVLHLIHITLPDGREDLRPGVLDVRRGKLYEPTREIADIDALLAAEAAAFTTLWDTLTV